MKRSKIQLRRAGCDLLIYMIEFKFHACLIWEEKIQVYRNYTLHNDTVQRYRVSERNRVMNVWSSDNTLACPYISYQICIDTWTRNMDSLNQSHIHMGLVWHLSQSFIRPLLYFSLIVESHSSHFLEPTSTKQWR